MYQFYFQKLNVWNQSQDLIVEVYKVIHSLPRCERFNLCDQLRRAVVSIPTNIAEGNGKRYSKEQVKFTSIAYGSLMELFSLIYTCRKLNYIDSKIYDSISEEIKSIARQLNALKETQQNFKAD